MSSIDTATQDRFWAKVRKGDVCWNWTACLSRYGYGHFNVNGTVDNAHRVAYKLLVGPIPDGYHIDHLCRNKRCVNPDHLEAVTPRDNILRGVGAGARNAVKTHCVHGHEYTEENTLRDVGGGRRCRTCTRARWSREAS